MEIITLYTAFVAGSVSMSTPSASFLAEYAKTHETAFDHAQTAHLAWVRWTVYGLLAACTVGVVSFGWRRAGKETDDRKAPVPEMYAATLAFLAWGLAMPGGLLGPYVATADLSFVSLAIATVAAGLLLALGVGTLRSPSEKLKERASVAPVRGVRWIDEQLVLDTEVPEPVAAAGDVMVEVAAASICGTDLHFMRAQPGEVVIGHEFAGWVDGVPCAIEPTVFCGKCEQCLAGHTNRCVGDEHTNIGIFRDGGLADRVAVPAYAPVALPDGLDVRDASLVEPTSVSWHGARRAHVEPGERVVVVGGGSIGLLAVACVRHLGHDVALEARHAHQIAAGERIGAATDPHGEYDVVIETAGSESGLLRAADLVRPGGRVVLLGNFQPYAPVPGVPTLVKEITWIGSAGRGRHDHGAREFAESAAVLAANPEIARSVITHRFPLAEAAEAFRVADDRASGAIKVVLEP